MPTITILYAGLLGLISIGLAVTIGRVRGRTGVSIGDGGNVEVVVAMRRHANFVEVVPLALILIGLLELNGVGNAAIHGLGAALVVARICHAIGYSTSDSLLTLRIIGAAGSTLITLIASIWAISVFF
jgi:uncharacterized membrane protein YecN with MAPEG domain